MINDFFTDVRTWNPAHRTWSDSRGRRLYMRLMGRCDATQVSSPPLAQRLADYAPEIVVFENQIADLQPMRLPRSDGDLVIGWGGSIGIKQRNSVFFASQQ